MAEAKKPEAPRPASAAVKTAAAVPAKAAVVPAKAAPVAAKTAAVPAKTAAVPARVGGVPAKTAGVPAKTATTGALVPAKTGAVPAKTGAVPAKTAAAPVKPALAAKTTTAGATVVATKDIVTKSPVSNDPAKPVSPDAVSAEDEGQNFEEMRNKFKPAKKPVAVPAELLGDAKSYDDKLILVKLLTEKEQSRVVLMIKNMLRSSGAEKKR
jgi:hypothetical protein